MRIRNGLIASAAFLILAASVSGCAFIDSDDEAVLEAADNYASLVAKVKVRKIAEAMADGNRRDIEALVSGEDRDIPDNWSDIVSAIADSISYEIDEDSVESSKKNREASVNITYTLVDHAGLFETVTEEGGTVDDFIEALGDDDSDTVEIYQTIDLVYEDGTWLVDDGRLKALSEVYDFYSAALDYEFVTPLVDYVDHTEWYYSEDDVYVNFNQIELDIISTFEGNTVEFEFTYEYYRDGNLIYTSDICSDQGYYIEAYYGPRYDSSAEVDEEGNLIAGEYRCVIYDLAGNVLADSTCTVETMEYVEGTDAIEDVEWYFSDNGVYVNESQIELDIITTSIGAEFVWNFYYEYYIDGELVFTSEECHDQGHWIEAYYGPQYVDNAELNDDGYLIPGQYRCIIYDMDGNVLADDTCQVVVR